MNSVPLERAVHCPACGLRCIARINCDAAECPEHGWISGLMMLELEGCSPVDALIELRAAQLHNDLRTAFHRFRDWAQGHFDAMTLRALP